MENFMTLQEYLNQENPVRKPLVGVGESEIKRGVHMKLIGFTSIWIRGIFNEYALHEKTGYIYTIDLDGNPKSISVFRLVLDVLNPREKSIDLPHN
jgi:hypothetical protein